VWTTYHRILVSGVDIDFVGVLGRAITASPR
jgi:hypothetical protein